MNVFVSKSFKKKFIIESPEDLRAVDKVRFSPRNEPRDVAKWVFEKGAKKVEVDVKASLRTNDYQAVLAAVKAGYGYGVIPSLVCRSEVEAGRLIEVLPDWSCGVGSVYAVFPSRKFVPRKTSAFLDFLKTNWPPNTSKQKAGDVE